MNNELSSIKELKIFVNQFGEAWLSNETAKRIEKIVKSYMKNNVEDSID